MSVERDLADTTGVATGERVMTLTEAAVLKIWEEALKQKGIGLDDCFFDIGGHSLVATLCINAIRAELGVELPLDVFFLEPASIASISELIDQERRERSVAV
jgi:hypothetical protein